ncbi:uncharacterized protein [Symphalangus syndactylus]|uniref:uncharacterized protein n=1 Tax=Symphalangus syndactylus TaxID=9590 RepID=UPI003004AA20
MTITVSHGSHHVGPWRERMCELAPPASFPARRHEVLFRHFSLSLQMVTLKEDLCWAQWPGASVCQPGPQPLVPPFGVPDFLQHWSLALSFVSSSIQEGPLALTGIVVERASGAPHP